jgi:CHAT domain-containing protein
MAFSRFMSGSAVRHDGPISKGSLRLLLVASNPEGLRRLQLEDINLSVEKSIVTHATESLGETLVVEKYMPNVTVEGLAQKQAAEGFQLVHILAHTIIRGERSFMVLADGSGNAQEVECQQVVSALTPADALPHLVFLAAPMVAEASTGPALVTMSPWLVDAGVRAAIAIQGPISEDRLVNFCNSFYETLITTGVIDVALMVARSAIFDPSCWEWANAVLYMRTASGELFRPLPANLRGLVSAAAAL